MKPKVAVVFSVAFAAVISSTSPARAGEIEHYCDSITDSYAIMAACIKREYKDKARYEVAPDPYRAKAHCNGIAQSSSLRLACLNRETEARDAYRSGAFPAEIRSYCERITESWSIRLACAEREIGAKRRLGK